MPTKYHNYLTHLGGELVDHDWIDLKPLELLNATMSSAVRAAAIAELAQEQIAAAHELGDTFAVKEYSDVLMYLSRIANYQSFKYY